MHSAELGVINAAGCISECISGCISMLAAVFQQLISVIPLGRGCTSATTGWKISSHVVRKLDGSSQSCIILLHEEQLKMHRRIEGRA